jgi:hypothetical protein
MTVYVDVDHVHDLVTRRFITGILDMLNDTPVRWVSKRQEILFDKFLVGYVLGSVIVMYLHIRSLFPFLRIVYGPIRSIHILSQGVASASFGGGCPYFLTLRLFLWYIFSLVIRASL